MKADASQKEEREQERMANAFQKGVATDHFDNSKMMIAHFPDIMKIQ